MASVTTRAGRLLKAMETYSKATKRWDAMHLIPKIKISNAGNGNMIGTFKVTEDICNMAGTLHGGFITTAIDYLTFFSVAQHPRGSFSWTTDMSVSFLNITKLGETISIETKPVRLTKTRAVMECLLTNKNSGKPVAKGTVGFTLPDTPMMFLDVFNYDPTIKDE